MSSKLGELLLKKGLITEEQKEKAEKSAVSYNNQLSTALIKLEMISEADLANEIATRFKLKRIDVADIEIESDTLKSIPSAFAIKHNVLPIEIVGEKNLIVAMSDPSRIGVINDLKFSTGKNIAVVVAEDLKLTKSINQHYKQSISYDEILGDMDDDDVEVVEDQDDFDVDLIEKQSEDAPVVKLVNAILVDAISKGVSDIHLEPYEKEFRVRFRIDGVLYEIMKPPYKMKDALISRLKIMADLDIAERRLPQDGRIKLKIGGGREMDYRVSVLPGLFGEKVVLRLLDKGNLQTDMTKLGFSKQQFKDFNDAIQKPYGLVLVTGPTGSGKTTTLYSALTELNSEEVNIATAEDPVEFNLLGINQVQMNDDIGLNFAAALRSFLRQDPDIIMVGEIRDYETGSIAIKASLTGHLVLSTLHTNDAPSTINRMLNMGIEPFLVASSVNIVVAQRLARKICTNCKEQIEINPNSLITAGIPASEASHIKVYKGKGCKKCGDTGYKGRIALYECLVMSETIRELVLNGASTAEIKRAGIEQGMATLRASGLTALKEGITTLEEVMRVTASD